MNRKHKIFVRTSLIRRESEINWARWELVSDNASCSVQSTCNINLQHVINTEYSNANQVTAIYVQYFVKSLYLKKMDSNL